MGRLDAHPDIALLPREEAMAILEDHNARASHTGKMMLPDAQAVGYNPVCGDRYEVFLRREAGRIKEVRFHGFGCVISRASASMMAEIIEGLTEKDARRCIHSLHAAVVEGAELHGMTDEVRALLGVREHPSRVKCVLLPWQAASAALRGESTASTE